MQNLINNNLKRALELSKNEEAINADLIKLREELSFIAKTVSSKVQQLEKNRADMRLLQEETSAYITSGKWVTKEDPTKDTTLSGVPATSAAIILPALDRNTLWNSLKNILKNMWKFFSSRLKPKNQSNQVE
jgi:hypothetical protein